MTTWISTLTRKPIVNLSSDCLALEGFQDHGVLIPCPEVKKTAVMLGSGGLQSPEYLKPFLRGKYDYGEVWLVFRATGF